MANCCVVGCSNSYYRIQRWLQCKCDLHPEKLHSDCGCNYPFKLLPFPKDERTRAVWVAKVNRKDGKDNWLPKSHSRICTVHFKDGGPTDINPYPDQQLGYKNEQKPTRKPPRQRLNLETAERTTTTTTTTFAPLLTVQAAALQTVQSDHSYSFSCTCDCSDDCSCHGCLTKQLTINKLRARIHDLEKDIKDLSISQPRVFSVDSIPRSNKKVRLYLGIPNVTVFYKLLEIITPKCRSMRYWKGQKRVISTKATKTSTKRPCKPGPKRKLSIKHEFMLTLMKLRLNLTMDFLSDLFGISLALSSQIFATWIKCLAQILRNLIHHPSKEEVKSTLPKSFKAKIPQARGIIDCSEFFIEKPNSLDMQAATWSDYKQHNTVKVLIDISPTGIIQFKSKAWGGRTSDKHIVLHSGYLDTIEQGDVVLADRGFPIAEELLLRGARLYIPPGSRGAEQMTREKVLKTKTVANLRIHVERAINRLKWFRILCETMPITMVPLIDDIITVCSALINLYPPLVK